jgi:molybdenum cofactor cytidylyltransferase
VTGAKAKEVQSTLQTTTARFVDNPNWNEGMGTSIAAGSRAVDTKTDGLMILLCDQWRISRDDLMTLTETWRADPQRIICSESNERYGPPVIFPSSCFAELKRLKGDHGAHSILSSNPDLLTAVPMRHAAKDLDTPAQLEELREEHRNEIRDEIRDEPPTQS